MLNALYDLTSGVDRLVSYFSTGGEGVFINDMRSREETGRGRMPPYLTKMSVYPGICLHARGNTIHSHSDRDRQLWALLPPTQWFTNQERVLDKSSFLPPINHAL